MLLDYNDVLMKTFPDLVDSCMPVRYLRSLRRVEIYQGQESRSRHDLELIEYYVVSIMASGVLVDMANSFRVLSVVWVSVYRLQ